MAEITRVERGLLPDKRYVARVRAISSFGIASEWSEAVEFVTPADASKPNPPSGLGLDFTGSSLFVSWTPPGKNTDGTPLVDFGYFLITISDGTSVVEYQTQNTSFVYGLAENQNDFGAPKPSLTVEVRTVDTGRIASDPVSGSATNPEPLQPVNPGIFVSLKLISVTLQENAADSDIKHFEVEKSTDGGVSWSVPTIVRGDTYIESGSYSTEYRYRYKSVDYFNQKSPYSNSVTVNTEAQQTQDQTPPIDVTNFAITANTIDTNGNPYISFEWDPNNVDSDLSHFSLRSLRVSNNFVRSYVIGPGASDFTVTDLVQGEDYEFTLTAVDFTGNQSAPAGPLAATVAVDNNPPAVPQNLFSVANFRSITLRWDVVPGRLDYYKLYASETAGVTTASPVIYQGTSNVFVHEFDENGPYTRYYAVSATGTNGVESALSTEDSETTQTGFSTDDVPPTWTATLTATPNTYYHGSTELGYVDFSWTADPTDNIGVTGVIVRYQVANSGVWQREVRGFEPGALGLRVTNLDPGSEYDFELIAVDAAGNQSSPPLAASNIIFDTDKNVLPQNLNVTLTSVSSDSPGTITATWAKVSVVPIRHYIVQIDDNGNQFPSPQQFDVDGNRISLSGVTGATYHVRVKAVDEFGVESAAWSNVLFATVEAVNTDDLGSIDLGDSAFVGQLQADKIIVGSTTTFQSGYNPSTKETPTGAQAKADQAEADAIEAAAIDASNKASAAQAAAISAANTYTDGTVDGLVTTYYQVSTPTGSLGDLWIKEDTERLYRYNGSTWVEIQDQDIATAIADAATAQNTADGKIRAFYNPTMPGGMTASDVGDLWFDTDDNNKPYVWDGAEWDAVTYIDTAAAAAQAAAITAANTYTDGAVDGLITTYYSLSTEPPASPEEGDLWFRTDTDKLYRYDTTLVPPDWVLLEDAGITEAIGKAEDAQITADGKIQTFYLPGPNPPTLPPDTTLGTGDLWFNESNDDELHRWNGTAWISVRDGAIATLNQSIADINTDIANISDELITTYFSATAPASPEVNDLWYETDTETLYRYNGATWDVIPDTTGIGAAYEAAKAAEAVADGKVQAFYQPGMPAALDADVGDLWFDTDDQGKAYYWDGSNWKIVQEAEIVELNTSISTINQTLEDDLITTYFKASTDAPISPEVNDLWYKTDLGTLHRYNGATWDVVTDTTGVGAAYEAAKTAEALADKKIQSFYQPAPGPADDATNNLDQGDLWFDTTDGNNIPNYWNDATSAWVPIRDGGIADLNTAVSNINTDINNINDELITTYFSDTQPTGEDNDLWYDTVNLLLYRHNGAGWGTPIPDTTGIGAAYEAAKGAEALADKKIQTFYDPSAPLDNVANNLGTGDLWVETDNGNKLHRWNGTWQEVPLGAGALDVSVGGGNVLTNSRADNGTTDWTAFQSTIAASTDHGRSGPRSFAVTSTSTNDAYLYRNQGNASQRWPVEPGDVWTISGWAYSTVARTGIQLQARIYLANATSVYLVSPDYPLPAGAWTRFTYTVTMPANAITMGASYWFAPTAAGQTVYWTDLQVEQGDIPTAYAPLAETPEGAQAKADAAEANSEPLIPKQTNPPTSPVIDELWWDIGSNPTAIKRWDGSAWVAASPTDVTHIANAESVTGAQEKATAVEEAIRLNYGGSVTSTTIQGGVIVTGTVDADVLLANTSLVTNMFVGSGGFITSTNFDNTDPGRFGYRLSENSLEFYGGSIILGDDGLNINTVNDELWFGASTFAAAKWRVDGLGNMRVGIDDNKFNVNADGSLRIGGNTTAAPVYISNAGAATFKNVTLTGTSMATGAKIIDTPGFDVTKEGAITATSGTIAGTNITTVDGVPALDGGTITGSTFKIKNAGGIVFDGTGNITWNGGTGGIQLGGSGYINDSAYRANNNTGFHISDGGIIINQGTIKAAALQIGVSSENLLTNSSFENGTTLATGWASSGAATFAVSTEQSLYQSKAQKVTSTGTDVKYIQQDVTKPGGNFLTTETVAVSYWIKQTTGTVRACDIQVLTTANVVLFDGPNVNTVIGSWVRVTAVFRPSSAQATLRVRLRILASAATEVFYIDGAQLQISDFVTSYAPKALEIPDNYIQSAYISGLTADRIDTGTLSAATISVGATGFIQSMAYTAPGTNPTLASGYRLDTSGLRIHNGALDIVAASTANVGFLRMDGKSLRLVSGTNDDPSGVNTVFKVDATGLYLGGNDAGSSSFYFDRASGDVIFQSKDLLAPNNNQLIIDADGTTDNKVIRLTDGATDVFFLRNDGTGSFSQQNIGNGAGYLLDETGLRFWSNQFNVGTPTLELDSLTGDASFAGSVSIREAGVDFNTNLILSADVSGSTALAHTVGPPYPYKDGIRIDSGGYTHWQSGNGADRGDLAVGNGTEVSYFQADFGEVKDIAELRTYWYRPSERNYFYKVKYSRDGTNWYYAVGGAGISGWMRSTRVDNSVSLSTELPTVNLFEPRISARYIRIYGDGNTVNTGNHVYEIEAYTTKYNRPALSVGRNFMVNENGDLYANSGRFSGVITASSGSVTGNLEIGANLIVNDPAGGAKDIYFGNSVYAGSGTFVGINMDRSETGAVSNFWAKQSTGRILFRVGNRGGGGPYMEYDSSQSNPLRFSDAVALGELNFSVTGGQLHRAYSDSSNHWRVQIHTTGGWRNRFIVLGDGGSAFYDNGGNLTHHVKNNGDFSITGAIGCNGLSLNNSTDITMDNNAQISSSTHLIRFKRSGTLDTLVIGANDVIEFGRNDDTTHTLVVDVGNYAGPGFDNGHDLGASGRGWNEVYSWAGITSPSSMTFKSDIAESDLGLDFINGLKPVRYKLDNGNSGRPHYGMIAEDVKGLIDELQIDFAGFVDGNYKWADSRHNKDREYQREELWGLRYHEFIAPMIKALQEISDRLDAAGI